MDEELAAILCVGGIGLALIIGIGCALSSWECGAKWGRSGFDYDWGPIQGCMLRVDGNKWIPSERYREIEE